MGDSALQGKKHVGGKGTIWVGNVLKKNLGEDMSKKGTTPGPGNLADIANSFDSPRIAATNAPCKSSNMSKARLDSLKPWKGMRNKEIQSFPAGQLTSHIVGSSQEPT